MSPQNRPANTTATTTTTTSTTTTGVDCRVQVKKSRETAWSVPNYNVTAKYANKHHCHNYNYNLDHNYSGRGVDCRVQVKKSRETAWNVPNYNVTTMYNMPANTTATTTTTTSTTSETAIGRPCPFSPEVQVSQTQRNISQVPHRKKKDELPASFSERSSPEKREIKI